MHALADTDENSLKNMISLLRFARLGYESAIKKALKKVDCNDIPKNGIDVIIRITQTATSLESLKQQLGISKQAAGQLADGLAKRGYINRVVNPLDRRRTNVTLTERGQLAAAAALCAIEAVESKMLSVISKDYLLHTVVTLKALADNNN